MGACSWPAARERPGCSAARRSTTPARARGAAPAPCPRRCIPRGRSSQRRPRAHRRREQRLGSRRHGGDLDPEHQRVGRDGQHGDPRAFYALNLLGDGRVLAAGGLVNVLLAATHTAEVYSPTSGTWSAAANLNTARYSGVSATLASGPMVVGGDSTEALRSRPRSPTTACTTPGRRSRRRTAP